MSTERVTVSLPAELRQAVQKVADESGIPFSAAVSGALSAWIRGQLVDAWLADHQAEHGAFEADELRALAVEAGVPYVRAGRARSGA